MKETTLFKITWPIFIELALQILVGSIDQIMISNYSQNAVGAVQNANQIFSLIIMIFNVTCLALTILISQYLGAGETKRASSVITIGIILNIVAGIVVSILLLGFGNEIYGLLKVPEELMADTIAYTYIVGAFVILDAMIATFSSIFKSVNLMKYSMIVSIAINIFNIIGNAFLINGLGPFPVLGVKGAAISTVISRIIGLIIIIYIYMKKSPLKASLKSLKPFPYGELNKILQIGIPSGGESISYNLSQTVILGMINMFGIVAITSKSYLTIAIRFSYLFAMAVGAGSQIMIGRYIGAEKYEEVDKLYKKTLVQSIIVSVSMDIILIIFLNPILGIFKATPVVIELSRTVLFVDAILQVGKAGNIITVKSLQATGDVKYPIIIGIISQWAVAVLFAYIFGIVFNMGLVGVWIGMALDDLLRFVIFFIRWQSGKWKEKSFVV